MNGFERRTEQKKKNIRDAAMELFRAHGFKKVSIGDIARKACVSHVTIYNHFGGKDELIRDIVKMIAYDLIDKSREIILGNLPYGEKLKLLVSDKIDTAAQFHGEIIHMIGEDYPEMKRISDDIREKELSPLIDKLIDEGKKLKYIRQELPTQSIKVFFQIMKYGIYADQELRKKIEDDPRLLQDIYNVGMSGILEKPI